MAARAAIGRLPELVGPPSCTHSLICTSLQHTTSCNQTPLVYLLQLRLRFLTCFCSLQESQLCGLSVLSALATSCNKVNSQVLSQATLERLHLLICTGEWPAHVHGWVACSCARVGGLPTCRAEWPAHLQG